MQYDRSKRNPKTGIDQSPMGAELGWADVVANEIYAAKKTKVGSISRRLVAQRFLRSALKSLGTIESYDSEIPALGINTWVIPYLENAIALLSGEDSQIDW